MIFLKLISSLVKAFREGQTPGQIAAGFSIGVLIGLMPFWTLQAIFLVLVLFFVNLNLAAATLGILLADFAGYLLDPLFHDLGYFVLTQVPFLQNLWEKLYNLPIVPYTRFYNTVTLGSLLIGLLLTIPAYAGMKKLVLVYRGGLETRIKKWKIVRMVRGSKLVQWYLRIRDMGGGA